jgi:hypothetical protein
MTTFHPRARRNAFRRRDVRQQRRVFFPGNPPEEGRLLEQAEQFEDDYDNDNYSDYVENASVHAGD